MSTIVNSIVTFLCADTADEPVDPALKGVIDLPLGAFTRFYKLVREHEGVLVRRKGAPLCAAFPEPGQAVAMAMALFGTSALGGLSAMPGLSIALCTGPTGQYDNRYFGATIERALQLLAAAHASTIVLDKATAEAMAGQMPPNTRLHNCGPHRLRDLLPAEPIYQLVGDNDEAIPPPPRGLEAYPHNLPVQTTHFLGREEELDSEVSLLNHPDVRLLTLVAQSGSGKTRFGLQLATRLLDRFHQGVYFINLAPVTDPDLVLAAIAQAVGVKEHDDLSMLTALSTFLRERQVLLILDNFEQVLKAAPLVETLLAETQHLHIIVTSHVPLGIAGEHVFNVPALSLPARGPAVSSAFLIRFAAVELFVERAQYVAPGFVLHDADAPAVAQICRLLNGLPLSLELVAAYCDELSPTELLEQLSALSTAPTLSLTDVLRWSYERLNPGAQSLFARLGVFVGGCVLDAIELVCNAIDDLSADLLDEMALLIRRNLLLEENLAGHEVRYIMLDCVYDFAQEQLYARGETALTQLQHANYYRQLAEMSKPMLKGPEQDGWFQHLVGEVYNIRKALHWSVENLDGQSALRMSESLYRFWLLQGYLSEGQRWLASALALPGEIPAILRADALVAIGSLAMHQTRYEQAQAALEEGYRQYESIGDRQGMARSLSELAGIHFGQNDLPAAQQKLEASMRLSEEIHDNWSVALAANNLGLIAYHLNDLDRAEVLYQSSLEMKRRLADKDGVALALTNLAEVTVARGALVQAWGLYHESLTILSELEAGGEPMCEVVEAFAAVLSANAHAVIAAQLFGAMEARRDALACPVQPHNRDKYDRDVAAVHAALGDEAFHMAWTEGRALMFKRAVALALGFAPPAVVAVTLEV
jgi:predicted ATPase/class 3 adenylate cyclase